MVRQHVVPISVFLTVIAALLTPALVSPSIATATATASAHTSVDSAMSELDTLDVDVAEVADQPDAYLNRWILSLEPDQVDLGLGRTAAELGTSLSRSTAQTLIAGAVRELGAQVTDRYEESAHLVVQTDGTLTEQDLLDLPGVVHATRDLPLKRMLASGLDAIEASDADLNTAFAGSRADGTGQVVVIIDDGIDRTHPFFAGPGGTNRVVKEYCANRDFGSNGCRTAKEGVGVAAQFDGDIHGTHVAGIAAGAGGPSLAPRGLAQSSNIWAAKVFGSGGGASIVDIDRALQWVLNRTDGSGVSSSPAGQVAVVNMSLGADLSDPSQCPGFSLTTNQLVQDLAARNIAVVVAAGNAGKSELSWPACIPEVIAVGATNSNKASPSMANFSNRGTALADSGVVAPGVDICSSIPNVRLGCLSGTSMSAPMVAGVVAVLRQVSNSATPTSIRSLLRSTGTSVGDSGKTYLRINLGTAISVGTSTARLNFGLRDGTSDIPTSTTVPLAGRQVTVSASSSSGSGLITSTFVSPANGQVRLAGLALDQSWDVTVSATGFKDATVSVTSLPAPPSLGDVSVSLSAITGSLTGTVSTSAEQGLPTDLIFNLIPEPGNLWPASTLAVSRQHDGSFNLPFVRVGQWKLQVTAGLFASAAVPLEIEEDSVFNLELLSMDAPIGTVELAVTDGFSGDGFERSLLVIATPAGDVAGRVARTITFQAGSNQTVTLPSLLIGQWEITASAPGYLGVATSVSVSKDVTISAEVNLQPGPREVSGVVGFEGGGSGVSPSTIGTSAEGAGVKPGEIEFVLAPHSGTGPEIAKVGQIGDSGSYRVEGVPAGQWNVTVSAFGWTTGSALPLTVEPDDGVLSFSFGLRPVVQSSGLSRTSGSTSGGESVTINGIHFLPVTDFEASTGVDEVRFGDVSSSSPTIASDGRSLTVNAPARSAGTVQVQAFRNGTAVTGSFSYTYIAPSVDDGGGGGGGGGGSSNTGEVVNVALPAPVGGVATVPVSVPAGELRLGFQGLTGVGELRVEPRSDAPATGATGVTLIGGHLEITLTGANFREVELCIPYRTEDFAAAGVTTADLRLVHFVGSQGRTDITTRIDTAERKVCGRATSFSPFGIGVYQTQRIAGSDRYQTAVQISAAQFSPGVPVVYLANGLQFPDALSAAAAAAREGGPVLLTDPTRLPTVVRNELIRLRPARVVVVGGTAAVRAEVEQAVRTAVPSATVQRRQGPDRYQTAAAISRAVFPAGVNKVYLATGLTFPDALAGAAAAGRDGAPVLLVPGTGGAAGVPEAVATELARLNPSEVIILGGTAAISAVVSTRVGQILPQAVRTRVEGRDRYETASRLAVSCAGARVYAATGVQFADALAGAVAAGRSGCPMLLIPPSGLTTAVRNRLSALKPGEIVVLGGSRAVSFSNESALANYLP